MNLIKQRVLWTNGDFRGGQPRFSAASLNVTNPRGFQVVRVGPSGMHCSSGNGFFGGKMVGEGIVG